VRLAMLAGNRRAMRIRMRLTAFGLGCVFVAAAACCCEKDLKTPEKLELWQFRYALTIFPICNMHSNAEHSPKGWECQLGRGGAF